MNFAQVKLFLFFAVYLLNVSVILSQDFSSYISGFDEKISLPLIIDERNLTFDSIKASEPIEKIYIDSFILSKDLLPIADTSDYNYKCYYYGLINKNNIASIVVIACNIQKLNENNIFYIIVSYDKHGEIISNDYIGRLLFHRTDYNVITSFLDTSLELSVHFHGREFHPKKTSYINKKDGKFLIGSGIINDSITHEYKYNKISEQEFKNFIVGYKELSFPIVIDSNIISSDGYFIPIDTSYTKYYPMIKSRLLIDGYRTKNTTFYYFGKFDLKNNYIGTITLVKYHDHDYERFWSFMLVIFNESNFNLHMTKELMFIIESDKTCPLGEKLEMNLVGDKIVVTNTNGTKEVIDYY